MGKLYKTIIVNGHPMPEHRYLMEQYLGRKLQRQELIHHINEDGKDNRIENLQVVTAKEHKVIHLALDKKNGRVKIRKTNTEPMTKKVTLNIQLLDRKQITKLLGVSENTVMNYEKKGLPVYRITKKRYLYSPELVMNWIKKHKSNL